MNEPKKPFDPESSLPRGGSSLKAAWKVSAGVLLSASLLLVGGEVYQSRRGITSHSSPLVAQNLPASPQDGSTLGLPNVQPVQDRIREKLSGNHGTKMSAANLSLPLFFEANRGQSDPRVQFLARSGGYTLFLTPTETVLAQGHTKPARGPFGKEDLEEWKNAPQAVVRMTLLGGNPSPFVRGEKLLPGKVNYLIGKNPANWHIGVPLYSEVHTSEVYPGIELVFHGNESLLEYDFVVAPGADPGQIRFKVSGANRLQVDESGDLVLHAANTQFRMHKPAIYQQIGDQRRPVDGGFSLKGGKLVAFELGNYDKKLPLVIDPSITFATFFGGAGTEVGGGVDLDVTNPASSLLYVAGTTSDITSFTESHTLLGASPGATGYGFIAKIDPTTTGAASLKYLTFIGGSTIFAGQTGACQNSLVGMRLDQSGGAGQVEPVLSGDTDCSDFPVTFGGPSTGTDDIFITRLTPDGGSLDTSTLLGGNGSESQGGGLFVDPQGTVIFSGATTSTNLPTTTGAYTASFNNGTPGSYNDCYVVKMNRTFAVQYLTYLNVGAGSTSTAKSGCGLGGVDPSGKIYAGGNIHSTTAFNLVNGGAGANGFQKNAAGTAGTTVNAFVMVLDPSQTGLNQAVYESYFGGGGPGTQAEAGALDAAHGIVYVVGETFSNSTTNAPDIPLQNAFQTTNTSGSSTGLVFVIDTTKTGAASLVASSYLGGNAGTSIRSVAFDAVPGNPPTQRVVVAGQTAATNFPTLNPLQSTYAGTTGGTNGFVTVLSVPSSGFTYNMSTLFSTYLGAGTDSIRSVATDANHSIYALGETSSANFFGNTTPATTVNGFQTTCASCGGGTPQSDLVIFELSPQGGTSVPDLTVAKSHTGNFTQGQTGATFSITVTNSGTAATVGTVSVTDTLPSGLTATAMSGSGWNCSLGTLTCTRSDALAAGASYQVITLTVNVSSQAPPSVTNKVVVSGGSETNTANNTASDTATVNGTVGACTDNYIGANNGSWGTATNWSTGNVPGASDVACITSSSTTVLLNTGLPTANQTIAGLNSSGTLNISAGPLTLTGNSTVNVLNISGGGLIANGQLTVTGASSQTAGTFGGTGEIDLEQLFSWSGGFICSTATGASCGSGPNAVMNANGGFTFTAASVVLSNRTVNVMGTSTWSGTNGSLTIENGAIVNLLAGAIWNYANDSNLSNGGGTAPVFNNAGTFEKTAGTGTTTVTAPFGNSNTVSGTSGTMAFNGGGTCGGGYCPGTYSAGSSGTINFNAGLFQQGGPITGAGTISFGGATIDFGTGDTTLSAATLKMIAGTLAGAAPGVINLKTPFTWSGGFICSELSGISCVNGQNATINADAGINFTAASVALSNRTLNLSSTAIWSGGNGNFNIENGAIINILPTGIWNFANDSVLSFGGGPTAVVNNSGLFEKTAGTSTSTITAPFNNSGTVSEGSGTLNFAGGGSCGTSCAGTYTAATGGTLTFSADVFHQSGPINGAGTVNFSGATMDFGTGTTSLSATTMNQTGGTLAGASPGVINLATPLNWSGGFICSSLSGASCVVGTNATLNATAGLNFITANVALTNRTINLPGTATWSGSNGAMSMENGAILNIQPGGIWNYANDSSLSNSGGTAPAVNNLGTFEKTGGTSTSGTVVTVPFNNATNGTATGTVLGNSGLLEFAGGGNCGSSCPGTFTANAGGTIAFSSGIFAQSGLINGAGTINFNGATMDFGTGSTTLSAGTINFISGSIGGNSPGIINFTTPLNWSGGVLCSGLSGISCVVGTNASVEFNAGINFPGSASTGAPSVVASNRTMDVFGNSTWSGTAGGMTIENGAILNIKSGAVWNYTNDSTLSNGGGTAAAVNNSGTFEKTGGTSSASINTPFNNNATVNATSGTLLFQGGGNCGSTCAGTYFTGTSPNLGTISFAAGTFAQSGPITGGGSVNFSGATMDFGNGTETISAANVTLSSGTIAGAAPGVINITNLLTWTGGGMCSALTNGSCVTGTAATTNTNGGITFPNTAQLQLNGRALNTAGTTAWTSATVGGGDLLLLNGASITNSGTWDFQNDSYLDLYTGASNTITNNGIFQKSGGTTTTTLSGVYGSIGTFNNGSAGQVLAKVGQLNVNGGGTGGGSWSVSAGASLRIGSVSSTAQVFAISGPMGGAGTVIFAGATENITGAYNVTGATQVTGGITNWVGPGAVTNVGALTISNGVANFSSGSPINTSTMVLSGGGQGGTDTVTVSGLTTWSGGTMCTSFSNGSCVAPTGAEGVTSTNGGMTFPSTSQLQLNGRTLNTGGTTAWTSATVSGGDLLLQNGAIINNSGTWDFQNDSYVDFYTGAGNMINNNGIFQKSGGTTTTTLGGVYGTSGTFNNGSAGQVLAKVGQLNINGGGTGGGSWSASAGANLQLGSITPTAQILAISGPVSGAGTVIFAGATENITGTYNVTGATQVTGGNASWLGPAAVTNVGALTISNGAANFSSGSPINPSTMSMSGGALGGTDTVTVSGLTTWSGGTMCTTLTAGSCVAPVGSQGKTVTSGISFPSNNQLELNGRTLNTSGTSAWTSSVVSGGDMLLLNGATINNSGVWDLQNDSYLFLYTGASNTFNNSGIFQKSGGTLTTGNSGIGGTVGVINNTGQFLALAGQMNLSGPFNQTAGVTSLAGGQINTGSPLNIAGGSVTGKGTLIGGISNSAGTVAPGTTTPSITDGTIAITTSTTGTYAQGASGAFSVKLGGKSAGQFDTLTTTGAITLNGALNVSIVNGYVPAAGDTFTILSGASVISKFASTNLPTLTAGLGWQVTYNATNVVLSVVTVSTPVASLNPSSLSFANTIVGSSSAVKTATLQNTGTSALSIASIAVTGADAANYTYTPDAAQPCGSSLAVGASCVLDIAFAPQSAGAHPAAQVTVTDNSGGVTGSTQTVTLSGTGIALSSIAITPTTQNLPQGATLGYTAIGTYTDSTTQNLTATATWASSNTGVATISNTAGSQGQARGVAGGSTFITAAQSGVTSNQATLTVTTATHYTVNAPGTAVAGTPINVSVTAMDQFGQVVPGYTGTVHFTSSDGQAVLPANATLTSGQGTFPVTLKTLGSQTVTATDTVTSTITGASNSITVGSGAATHFQVSAPSTATSGSPVSVTVTALDQFNNTATGYAGSVHFTSTDTLATLPANSTLTNGTGTFPVTFKTPGTQTVTATDTVTSTINGTSSSVTVGSGLATHFSVTAPVSTAAGTPINVVVTALDQFNNTVTGYTGSVHFTSTDTQATLPANSTLTNGTGTFPVTLKTPGTQTVTAADTVTSSITGTSNSITVGTGAATHFVVTAPASATAGTAISVTVTAKDQFNNTVTGYTGTVHFTSSDVQATLPANSTLTSGAGTFSVTLKTAGSESVTATDTVTSTITGTSNVITVAPSSTAHFNLAATASISPGTAFSVTVTAIDAFNNLTPAYTGTVHFTSSDAQATLPANSTLTSGTGTFSVTLKTTGPQTVTATDTVTSSITGTSNTITVGSGVATHFTVVATPSATAGSPDSVTVAALDQFGNLVSTYSGTVHFTSSDTQAILPANSTLTNGAGVFSVTFKTLGSQTVTATDTVTSSITGTSNTVTVGSGVTTHFLVSAPASASAGSPLSVVVTALDQFNNLVTTYSGTVHFTSSDTQAVLPANSTLTSGVGTFSVTLKTLGSQTVTATDTVTSTITGTSNIVTVGSGGATHYLVSSSGMAIAGTATSVTVTALDQFNNTVTSYTGTVHFTTSDAQATLPANSTLTNGTGTFSVTLKTVGAQTVTATDTVTSSITGSTGITVSSGAATHFSVTGPGSIVEGTQFSVTVTALDQFNNTATGYAGMVHITSSDAQAALPTNAFLSSGTGSFLVTLKTTGVQTVTATDTVTSSITGSTSITVGAGASTHFVLSAPSTETAGSPASVTVTARDAAGNVSTGYTGTVHFTSSDAQATLPANSTLTNGTGTFSVTLKTTGSQTVTATDTVTSTITGTSAPITVSSSAATHLLVTAPASAISGTPFSITVTALDQFNNTAAGYTGTLHFTSSDSQAVLSANSTLTNGTGTFSATLKTAGSQTITATDTVTSSITGAAQITVPGAIASSTVVASNLNPSTVNQSVIFTATVSSSGGTPTGSVSFSDNGSPIGACTSLALNGNGVATCSFAALTAGAHTILAAYNGSTNFSASSGSVTQNVNKASTTVALASSQNPSVVNQPVTFTATITPSFGGGVIPTGSVTFTDNSVAIANCSAVPVAANGTAACPTAALPFGSATITAVYSGDLNFGGNTNSVAQTVNKTSTTTGVTSSLNPSAAGNSVTFTATITPSFAGATQPSGSVVFSDGTNPITGCTSVSVSSNTAACTTSALAVGTHTINAVYGGDINFLGSNSSVSQTVATAVATLQSIAVTPAKPTLSVNGKLSFIAIGTYSDGSTQNLTSSVTWSSDTPSVATITSAGGATGVSQGTATISATLGAVKGTTLVTVSSKAPYAYVGDAVSATCCLDVVDTSTNSIVKTIPVTNINEPLGITPDQSRVYVPDNVNNLMNVIDTTTNTLMTTFTIGNGPTAVAITPDGKFGYVADYGDNNVNVFNVATNAVVTSISVGFGTAWLTITPDGTTVYAGSATDGRVAVVSVATNTLSSTFTLSPISGQPTPVAVSGPTFNIAGSVGYFGLFTPGTYTGPGTLSVVSIPNDTLVTSIAVGNTPFQAAITPDGSKLYVVNARSNDISVINTATNTVVATIPVAAHPESIAITPDGTKAYVALTNGAAVAVVDTSSNTVTASIATTVPFGIVIASPPPASQATTLTLTPPNLNFNSQVIGTTSAPQTIRVMNPGTTAVTLTSIGLSGPNVGDFHLVNGCPAPPNTLAGGGICNLQVSYGPSVSAASTALVTINSTNGIASSSQSAPLSGMGISLVSIAITPANPSVAVGLTVPLTATGTYSDNSTQNITSQVTWKSGTTSVATINASGVAIGVNSGTSSITASLGGITSAAVTLAVSGVNTSTTVTSSLNPSSVNQTVTFTASVTSAGGTPSGSVSFTAKGNPIAGCTGLTLSSSGVATCTSSGLTAGSDAIVASYAGNADFNASSGSLTQTVNKTAAPVALMSPMNPSAAGNTVTFSATVTPVFNGALAPSGSVTFTTNTTTITGCAAVPLAVNGTALCTTSGLPSGTQTITATYTGDSNFSGSVNSLSQTVNAVITSYPLTVTPIGTGSGTVTDNTGAINCVLTNGTTSGTCTANYAPGTPVNLTGSATSPSTFGGWFYNSNCSGTGGCSITMNTDQSISASFVPPPKMVPVTFTAGTNVPTSAVYCPNGTNPCTDANQHAVNLNLPQVSTPFTMTVQATEVPPSNGNGICENGNTPATDLDCRFTSFFSFQTLANGNIVVPLCWPYSNGNCVLYSVYYQTPGNEPNPNWYVGPVNWKIQWNNSSFVPTSYWAGSSPRLYDNSDGYVQPNSPYGTNCNTPMLIGNPGVPTNPAIYCQFTYDITTLYNGAATVGGDPGMGGKTKVFNDVIVAFPPTNSPVVTVTSVPDNATPTTGTPLGDTITLSNSAAASATGVALNDPLPAGQGLWSLSAPVTGCAISGAVNSQALVCTGLTVAQGSPIVLHVQSTTSTAGIVNNLATTTYTKQQILSIASFNVQGVNVTFSGLTASQTIAAGTASVTLGGIIGNGTQFPPSGETVSVSIDGVNQTATIGSNGVFTLSFPTASIPASATPYTISYSYSGDAVYNFATNTSTTLTVNAPPPGVNLSETLVSSTTDASGNYIFTIRITNSGAATASAATIKTAVLTTVSGTTKKTTSASTALPASLGTIPSLSSVTTTLTFPASAGSPNTTGAMSLGLAFTGGTASGVLKATLP